MKPATRHLILALAIVNGVLAGDAKENKGGLPAPIEPCFRDLEFHVEFFGTFTDAEMNGRVRRGYGGGVAAGVSFMRYFGFGVDSVFSDGTLNSVSAVSGTVTARYPVEFATLCFAPYVFTGIGVTLEGRAVSPHAGAGIEWRTMPRLAVFAEGRCSRFIGTDSGLQARLGIRLIF